MFARASAREREIAVRLALGASRIRLLQQFLMESLLLSGIGAVAGILLAQAVTRVLVSFFSTQFGNVTLDLGLDWRVLGFTAAVAIADMSILRIDAGHQVNRHAADCRHESRWTRSHHLNASVLVSVECWWWFKSPCPWSCWWAHFFLSAVFRILSIRTRASGRAGILAADFDFTQLNIPVAERNAFKQQMVDRMQALPGVDAAAAVDIVPVSGNGWNEDVHFDNAGKDVREISEL